MRYDVRRRTLTLGRHACRRCRKGKVATERRCRRCVGTGEGPRGGRGGCAICNGSGTVWDNVNLSTCTECGGDWEEASAERWTDRVPARVMELMPIVVQRVNRGNSFNESNLGMGTLYSSLDYGAMSRHTDKEVEEQVRADLIASPPQACKIITTNEGQRQPVCRSLTVTITNDGYAVRVTPLTLVTRPEEPPALSGQRPIKVAAKGTPCPDCHLIHVEGECGE